MSMYDEFREDENATVVITQEGGTTIDPVTLEPVYVDAEIFNDNGIFYELSASEKVSRSQIQKTATGQIILDPLLVTTTITEDMKIFVTTDDFTSKEYRAVTAVNPLNKNEAVIIDIIEN